MIRAFRAHCQYPTSRHRFQPIENAQIASPCASAPVTNFKSGCGALRLGCSESECAREDRAFHVDVEAQIAVARLIVKIEAAITQMKVDPRVESVVDRADDLPIAMGADAEAADIAVGGQAEAVAEIVVIASADQRIAPA